MLRCITCASEILPGGRLPASVAQLLRERQLQDGADVPANEDM